LNSLASMSWASWRADAQGRSAANEYGDEEPRRIFKQKRLALPWSEEAAR